MRRSCAYKAPLYLNNYIIAKNKHLRHYIFILLLKINKFNLVNEERKKFIRDSKIEWREVLLRIHTRTYVHTPQKHYMQDRSVLRTPTAIKLVLIKLFL